MAIQANFGGNCIRGNTKAAGPDDFGTTGLSGVSDFATHAGDRPRGRMAWKTLAMTIALVAYRGIWSSSRVVCRAGLRIRAKPMTMRALLAAAIVTMTLTPSGTCS